MKAWDRLDMGRYLQGKMEIYGHGVPILEKERREMAGAVSASFTFLSQYTAKTDKIMIGFWHGFFEQNDRLASC